MPYVGLPPTTTTAMSPHQAAPYIMDLVAFTLSQEGRVHEPSLRFDAMVVGFDTYKQAARHNMAHEEAMRLTSRAIYALLCPD